MVRTYVCVRFYLCPLDWSLFRALMHWLVNAWVIGIRRMLLAYPWHYHFTGTMCQNVCDVECVRCC